MTMHERIVEEIWKVAGDESVRDTNINTCADRILAIVREGLRKDLHQILVECFWHERPSKKVCDYKLKYGEAEERIIALTDVIAKLGGSDDQS